MEWEVRVAEARASADKAATLLADARKSLGHAAIDAPEAGQDEASIGSELEDLATEFGELSDAARASVSELDASLTKHKELHEGGSNGADDKPAD